MTLLDKLERWCDAVETAVARDWSGATSGLGEVVAAIMRDDCWETVPDHLQERLQASSRAAGEAARLLDAVDCVRDKVLQSTRRNLIEIPVTRSDLSDLRDRIEAALIDEGTGERGFVYVAWRGRPEEFWYVGKASSPERVLHLETHGKLGHALGESTTLSLLFPTQARADILGDLEASVLALVTHQTSRLPVNNERQETLRSGRHSGRLRMLGAFLDTCGRDVQRQVP
jgi:hypothetical protein